jgi:hypothetical protein
MKQFMVIMLVAFVGFALSQGIETQKKYAPNEPSSSQVWAFQ